MAPQFLLSFDCANTLLKTDWNPVRFAMDAAIQAGFEFEDELAAAMQYSIIYGRRLAEQHEMNRFNDWDQWQSFWLSLTEEWLITSGFPAHDAGRFAAHIQSIATQKLLSKSESPFEPMPGVLETLNQLRDQGHRLVVVSNWDLTLNRILEVHGLDIFFDRIAASLVYGVEKPNPRFFEAAYSGLGFPPERIIHIGDDWTDDVIGSVNAGIQCVWLKEWAGQAVPDSDNRLIGTISSLFELPTLISQLKPRSEPHPLNPE